MTVSGNYFDVVGVPMALGRPLTADDDRIGSPRAVVVISDALWERRFNRDPSIVGRSVLLNAVPFTIVGVVGHGFTGTNVARSELWLPITMHPALVTPGTGEPLAQLGTSGMLTYRAGVWMVAVGRLKPGVSLLQARDEVTRIAGDLAREYPQDNRGRSIAVEPSKAIPTPGRLPAVLFIALLFALVFLVLLIACVNIGAMLLARGVARARDISLQLALGASRGRLVRLLVTESLLLAAAGACLGVVVSIGLIRVLTALVPNLPLPVALDPRIDWRVLVFSMSAAGITTLLCGLMPALEITRTDLVSVLRVESSARGPKRLRLRQSFVVAQMAMSVLLVVVALLFGRSLMQAGGIDPGFTMAGVETVNVNLELAGYDPERGAAFVAEARRRIAQLPGVEAAAHSTMIPLTLAGVGFGPLRPEGRPFDPRSAIFPDWNIVSPQYFDTLRIPIRRGRSFTEADTAGAPAVVILNETLARRLFGTDDPIGRTVLHQDGPPPGRTRTLQIVGIARDGKYRTLGEAERPFVYVPQAQRYSSAMWFLARHRGPSVLTGMRDVLRRIDPNVPILRSGTLSELTAFGLLPQRIALWFAASVGIIALLLAMVGVYGITSHSVAQRRREIGIRVALGALRRQVLGMAVRQSLGPAMLGAVIGLVVAAGVAQLLTGLLYGIAAIDPVSFAGAAIALALVALVASLIPAKRATSVNPVDALRAE
jgi:predicted permease